MEVSPWPFVSVIVPACNAAAVIEDCLVSLTRMGYPGERREILVVDNGSSDHTPEVVKRYPVQYVREPQRGVCHARNRGIQVSRGEVLAFTDPDCLVSKGWLHELVQAFKEKDVGGVAGEIIPYPGRTPAERYAARRASHSQRRPMSHPLRPFAMTPNVAFTREVFRQIGLFDTRFPGGGWEDADLCWRLFRGTTFKLGYASKAVVFHRYRTTAKEFFVQHARYGYGLALICEKYRGELSWGWRQRLRAYRDLAVAARTLAMIMLRRRLGGDEPAELDSAYFDFLRQLGQRSGFILGALSPGRLHRAWFTLSHRAGRRSGVGD